MSSLVALATLATWLTRSGSERVCRPSALVKSVDMEGLIPRPLTHLCKESPWLLSRSDRELLRRVQSASETAHRLVVLTRGEQIQPLTIIVTYAKPESWELSSDRVFIGRDLVESEDTLVEILLATRFPPPLGGTRDHSLHALSFGQLYLGLLTGELRGRTLTKSNWSTLYLPGVSTPQTEIGVLLSRLLDAEPLPQQRLRMAQRLWRQALLIDLAWKPADDTPSWEEYHSKFHALSEQLFARPLEVETEMRQEWQNSKILFKWGSRFSPNPELPGLVLQEPIKASMEVWIQGQDPTLAEVSRSSSDFVLVAPQGLKSDLKSFRYHFQHRADFPKNLLSKEDRASVWSPESSRLAVKFGAPQNLRLPTDAKLLSPHQAELLGFKILQTDLKLNEIELKPSPIQPLLMMIGHAYAKD